MNFELNLNSARAKRARYAAGFAGKWMMTIYYVTLFGSVIISGGLLFIDYPSGWLTLIPGAVAAVFILWAKGDLSNDKADTLNDAPHSSVDSYLSFEMLSSLKNNDPSAYDLWQALGKSQERYFLANRFLIDGTFFEQLLDKNPGSAKAIWPIAEHYRTANEAADYSNMNILVSLVASVPGHQEILNTIQMSMADIETAIPWMADVLEKRRLANAKQSFGGIGRDWAYGYTPILQRLGYNISRDIELHGFFSDTHMHEQIVEQMVQMLNSGNGSVALIGDAGVGKTTCVSALAEYLLTTKSAPHKVRYNQVISLDAPTILANAQNPGQLEALMLRIFKEAHKAKNIILFFDDAEVFFGIGSSVDFSHVIQPALEAHSLRVVLAMSPSAWQRLAGTSLTGKVQPLNVPPADETNTLACLRDSISIAEYRNNVVFTYHALKEAYKLGSRYVTNLAMPGAALQVLEQTATTAKQQLITREIVQNSVEQTYGIKLQASTTAESTKLLNLESELRGYVISQDRAITVVSDALRRARSGVGNQNRPIGTFLFLGPTGVGKTELSKALARVYFGDEKSMIRVDMNQFVSSDDVKRLIQPMQGSELGFLGAVRKKPFSVILLDEIEKAHSSVVNALLQMLDEGTMNDADNRPVSFKDAIIIATSNAGADEIRRIIDEGGDVAAAEATFVDTLINRGLFAPEFVNRFDEVVVFKPLAADELLQVVDIILDTINVSLDAQKVQVSLSEAAKKWLVEKGYDSKLGARPMRRVIQRYVENTVAKRLLEHSVQSGGTINLDVSDFEEGK